MKVYAVQPDTVWEDREANLSAVRGLVERADPEAGSLVLLPEMFAAGFSMNVARIAEDPEGPTVSFLRELARERGVFVAGGVILRGAGGRGRNEALLVEPGGTPLLRYAKLHPFTPAGEREHYEAGDRVVVAELGDLRVAPFVCYDLRFPEVFRVAARRGADLLVVLANWPSPRAAHWRLLLQARAVENQSWVVGVNRCGTDPFHRYDGDTMVVAPSGEIVAEAGAGETVLEAEVDAATVRVLRERLPFLADAREDLAPPRPEAPSGATSAEVGVRLESGTP